MLWIGKKDKEGSFIWQGKCIHDAYFRYLKVKVLVDWLVDYLARKLKMGDALDTLEAGQLEVNFKEGRVDRERLVSSSDRSMFLLSRGALPEEFQGHAGRVWQCSMCSRFDNKMLDDVRGAER